MSIEYIENLALCNEIAVGPSGSGKTSMIVDNRIKLACEAGHNIIVFCRSGEICVTEGIAEPTQFHDEHIRELLLCNGYKIYNKKLTDKLDDLDTECKHIIFLEGSELFDSRICHITEELYKQRFNYIVRSKMLKHNGTPYTVIIDGFEHQGACNKLAKFIVDNISGNNKFLITSQSYYILLDAAREQFDDLVESVDVHTLIGRSSQIDSDIIRNVFNEDSKDIDELITGNDKRTFTGAIYCTNKLNNKLIQLRG